jgi:tRNA pseudouridine55 synthase
MILVIGKECKNAAKYSKLDKVYEATITLGKTSTTGDPEGEITEISDKKPSKEEVDSVIRCFVGEITQKPPIYSAIKIGGQRAYKLARKGEEIEIPERLIKIYSIDVISYSYPEIKIRTHVSSGTYIRSLAEDIGTKLEIGAYCSSLRRIQIGEYDIRNAKNIDEILGIKG